MPQGRIILKSISESKKIATLKTDGARLLYTWLITHLDVNGSFSGDPDVVNGKVFTRLKKSRETIESYLVDLESVGLIIRFNANGDIFLHVPDFTDKQPCLRADREGKTSIPIPTPAQLQPNSGLTPAQVKESKVKESKVNTPDKRKYLDHVFLTDEERAKLVERYGEKEANQWIERLDSGIGSKGYKYKSHYKTIISWSLKDERTGNPKSKPQRTVPERDFSKQESQYGQTIDV